MGTGSGMQPGSTFGGGSHDPRESGMMPELRVAAARWMDTLRAMPRPRYLSWYYISRILWHRRFLQLVAIGIVVLFVMSLDVEWKAWSARQLERVKAPVARAATSLQEPVQERSAFYIVDRFQGGLSSQWRGEATVSDLGYLKVNGLALRQDTLDLENYRFDFDFRIDAGKLGWVVRASDADNYYAFELERKSLRDSGSYDLKRYVVLGGGPLPVSAEEKSIPDRFVKNGLNTVSVRLRNDMMSTLFNGQGVDTWKDSHFTSGGVGFFADNDDEVFIRRMAVRGNEDALGLFLYGTVETIRSIRQFVSAPLAFRLQPTLR